MDITLALKGRLERLKKPVGQAALAPAAARNPRLLPQCGERSNLTVAFSKSD
jgi:hypothetical protein